MTGHKTHRGCHVNKCEQIRDCGRLAAVIPHVTLKLKDWPFQPLTPRLAGSDSRLFSLLRWKLIGSGGSITQSTYHGQHKGKDDELRISRGEAIDSHSQKD